MSDDFSKPPEWLAQAKVFWDATGLAIALPTWDPQRRAPSTLTRPVLTTSVLKGGVLQPRPVVPSPLVLYYVEDAAHGERWVPMSEALVQAFTELAAQQGVDFEWRAMPPTVSADKAMKR
jgi:hypothetical protein